MKPRTALASPLISDCSTRAYPASPTPARPDGSKAGSVTRMAATPADTSPAGLGTWLMGSSDDAVVSTRVSNTDRSKITAGAVRIRNRTARGSTHPRT